MKKNTKSVVLAFALLLSCKASYAELAVKSTPLTASISQADYVVEAKLLNYTANNTVRPFIMQPEGTYKFKVISILKGATISEIQVVLPQLSLHDYNFSAFSIKPGKTFLLLLKKVNRSFSPVDATRPLIPLADNALAKPDAQDVQKEVIRLMLASLVDANIRGANVYLLRDFVDPQVVVGLAAYLNDLDLRTRDAVLYCLATNQQVAVIPQIVQLAITLDRQGQGAESTETLENFTTPEAIPYLKTLIVAPDYLVRREAVRSLYTIADTSCIPYLMLALRDPDPEQDIPAAADLALHRIIPALGSSPLQSHDDYIMHRQKETNWIYDWWTDELNGKHVKLKDQAAASTSPASETKNYVPLFSPVASTRRKAALELEKDADEKSAPFLVLALQDPDDTVVYSAYKTLHRLVGSLGLAVMTEEQFQSNREPELKRIYSWWNAWLSPKTFQRPSTTGFIPALDRE